MHINVFVGSSDTRVYSAVDESGQPVDLSSAFNRIEICAAGRVLSSETESIVISGNTFAVKFGDFDIGNFSSVSAIVKFYESETEFKARELTSDGIPVSLSFRTC